tara:strand:+ start:22073 stop:22645 length:573 start_codon:yes stop_codon:yes gene_type:complete
MNIFILHEDPVVAAQMLCDRHVPKMIVESAQMLSTAHRLLDGVPEKRPSKSGKTIQTYYAFGDERDKLYYAAVHKHHPCTTWTMESSQNYKWHYKHFYAMGQEFTYRREKSHKTIELLGKLLSKIPENIPHGPLTPFAQAMSHYPMCKVDGDAVKAYRNYYHVAKDFAVWEWKRPAPSWWEGYKGASLYS